MSATKKTVSEVPIYISLSGDLYTDKNKTMVGTLNGDHRMAALEAFLDSLSNTSELSTSKGDMTLSDGMRALVDKCHPKILANNDVVIEVTCKMDTVKKEVCHTFRICTNPKKEVA